MVVQSSIETERMHRIQVSIWAYAYEVENVSLVPDSKFDEVCKKINPAIETGHMLMDKFFREIFDPCTGMWIHKHPEIKGIKRLFESITKTECTGNFICEYIPKEPEAKMNGKDFTGYNSYTMNLLYLAYLGFPIVPGIRSHHFKEYGITLEWNSLLEEIGGIHLVQGDKIKFLTFKEAGEVFFGKRN